MGVCLNFEKIFLTGASGFVGSNCIIEMLRCEYRLVASVKDPAKVHTLRKVVANHNLDHGSVTYKIADIRDPADLESAMDGCDAVIHVAFPVPLETSPDPIDLLEIARYGTLNVLEAARKNKINRIRGSARDP